MHVVVSLAAHFRRWAEPILRELEPVACLEFISPDDASALADSLERASVLVYSGVSVSSDVMDNAPALALIQKWGSGVDDVDLRAATTRHIYVANVPAGNASAVAEHFFALTLALTRRVVAAHCSVAKGVWSQPSLVESGLFELRGRRIGVVGYGAVGRRICDLALAFGMSVCVVSRRPRQETRRGVEQLSFADLLLQSDVVGMAVPLTADTFHMVDQPALARMPSNSLIVNVSRGSVVDEEALTDALELRAIAGAALDVFEHEPMVATRLRSLPNVILSPHIAGRTIDAMATISKACVSNIRLLMRGDVPLNLVKERGST